MLNVRLVERDDYVLIEEMRAGNGDAPLSSRTVISKRKRAAWRFVAISETPLRNAGHPQERNAFLLERRSGI
jgi:hypothetical protein